MYVFLYQYCCYVFNKFLVLAVQLVMVNLSSVDQRTYSKMIRFDRNIYNRSKLPIAKKLIFILNGSLRS